MREERILYSDKKYSQAQHLALLVSCWEQITKAIYFTSSLYTCIHYATKVANNPPHRSNHLIPPHQSQVAERSKRLTDRRVLRPRTFLYSKSLFSVLT